MVGDAAIELEKQPFIAVSHGTEHSRCWFAIALVVQACGVHGGEALGNKKCAEHTAQLHTLAAFLPWGGFEGASRPTRRKGTCIF